MTWNEETGPGPLPPRAVHLPLPLDAVPDARRPSTRPNGDVSCVRRSRSNTPLQALTTLNEPLVVEAARALARRVLAEGGTSDAERLTYAFRLCVSRPPTEAEREILLEAPGEAAPAVRRRVGQPLGGRHRQGRPSRRPAAGDDPHATRRPGPSSPACC